MIIQKAGVFKFLRYLGIFCALTMGFFSIVATSEDDVKDALDIDFDQDFKLETSSITVDKGDPAPAASFKDCEEDFSINQAIAAIDDPLIDGVSIDSVNYKALEIKYSNVPWPLLGGGALTCVVSITENTPPGDAHDATLPEINISQETLDWSALAGISQDSIDVISYYLANRNASFDICAVCTEQGGAVTDFAVELQVRFDVNIKGTI